MEDFELAHSLLGGGGEPTSEERQTRSEAAKNVTEPRVTQASTYIASDAVPPTCPLPAS